MKLNLLTIPLVEWLASGNLSYPFCTLQVKFDLHATGVGTKKGSKYKSSRCNANQVRKGILPSIINTSKPQPLPQHIHEDINLDAEGAVSKEHKTSSRLPNICSSREKTGSTVNSQHDKLKDTFKLPAVILMSGNDPSHPTFSKVCSLYSYLVNFVPLI